MSDNEWGGPDFNAAELAAGAEWLDEDGNFAPPEFLKDLHRVPETEVVEAEVLGPEDDDEDWDSDRWKARGKKLGERQRGLLAHQEQLNWLIGDWLIKGEKHIGRSSGETVAGYYIPANDVYSDAVEIVGLARRTLIDIASTVRRFPRSVRTDELSWSHHRVLLNARGKDHEGKETPPAELKRWLDKAIEEQMSVATFMEELKSPVGKPPTLEKSFLVTVPIGVWEALKDFADDEGSTVQEIAAQWISYNADQQETKMLRDGALKRTKERRYEKKRRQGKRLARNYPLLENR